MFTGKKLGGTQFQKRVCKTCGKRIPMSNTRDICNDCLKVKIFPQIRDFVRENDVSAFELAEMFDIDLEIVEDWLREGRLEYKNNHQI